MTETNITQFSNSFRVASYFDKASKGVSLCLWVKTGACCDPENKEGLSHLLEHTLFGLRKSANISHIYSSIINRQLNIKAFTKAEHTAFIIKSVDKFDLKKCIDILWEIYSGRWLSDEALYDAKIDISKEIDELSKDPEKILFEVLNSVCFPSQSYGRRITGTKETIHRIKVDDLVSFQKHYYVPEHSLICACGNIEHQQLVDFTEAKFSSFPKNMNFALPSSNWFGGIRKIKSVDKETRLACAIPFETKGSEQYYFYWILSYLLSKKTNNVILTALKREHISCDALNVYPEFLSHFSRMQIYLNTSDVNINAIMKIIMDELSLITFSKAEYLLKNVGDLEITSSLKLFKLKNRNIEHLAMGLGEYNLFPSEIPFPKSIDDIKGNLDLILENLYQENKLAIAYSVAY